MFTVALLSLVVLNIFQDELKTLVLLERRILSSPNRACFCSTILLRRLQNLDTALKTPYSSLTTRYLILILVNRLSWLKLRFCFAARVVCR